MSSPGPVLNLESLRPEERPAPSLASKRYPVAADGSGAVVSNHVAGASELKENQHLQSPQPYEPPSAGTPNAHHTVSSSVDGALTGGEKYGFNGPNMAASDPLRRNEGKPVQDGNVERMSGRHSGKSGERSG